MKSLLAPFLGLGFAVLVACVVAWIEVKTGFSLYGLTLLFVIPAGAFVVGLLAGVGYYIAARATGAAPGIVVLVSMICAAVLCYFLINRIPYEYLFKPQVEAFVNELRMQAEAGELIGEDGQPVDAGDLDIEVPSFWTYLNDGIRKKEMTIGRGAKNPVKLSPFFAYAHELVVIGGFVVGALAIFGMLKAIPYCEDCRRYLKKRETLARHAEDPAAVDALMPTLAEQSAASDPAGLVEAIREADGLAAKATKTTKLTVNAVRYECPNCQNELATFSLSVPSNNGPQEVPGSQAAVWKRLPEGVEAPLLVAGDPEGDAFAEHPVDDRGA